MRKTSPVEELRAGRSVVIYTVGDSMQPLLAERTTHVHLRPLDERGLKLLDIVLYVRDNGQTVLHRLVHMDDTHYYMRGDSTYGLESIRHDQAVGVAVRIYRKGKLIDVETDRRYQAYVSRRMRSYPIRYLAVRVKWKLQRMLKRPRTRK